MSDINVAFFYDMLEEFMSSEHRIVKSPQIIPYFYVKETGDVFPMLTLNRSGHLGDFSCEYTLTKSIESNIADSIKYNSLGSINIDEGHVKNFTFIGYSTSYNVSEGKDTVSSTEIPAIFVKLPVEKESDIHKIILDFKSKFAQKLKGNFYSSSDVTNLVYMSVENLFYICRFTTCKIVNEKTGDIVTIDIEEQGFPALDEITELYYADKEKGEIPCSDKFNELENCCPEVDFYTNRSLLLAKSLLPLFNNDLPVMLH